MNKLITVDSYFNVKGLSEAEIRDAAQIFQESIKDSRIGDIQELDFYHYLCFIEEKGETVVFVGTSEVMNRSGATELTKEQVFEANDVSWDGLDMPPVGTICRTLYGRKVRVVGYMTIGGSVVAVVQDNDREDEVDWVLTEILEPLKDEKQEEIERIAKEVLNSVNLIGQDFCHDELGVAKYLYDSGLRFVDNEEEDEDDSY